MSKYLYIISFLFLSISLNAQISDTAKIDIENKINYSIQIGTGIYSINNTSFVDSYIMPKINYKLSQRFTLSFGGIFMNSSLNSNKEPIFSDYGYVQEYYINNSFFVQGSYSVNERLTLYGSAYMPMNINNKLKLYDYSFGADYKLKNGMIFGVEIRKSNMPIITPFDTPVFNNTNFIRQ